MSITALGAIGVLYDTLKNGVLFTDVKKANGNLYRLQRPLNSKKEDVVIDTLGLGQEAVQKGILIVNTYVLNLENTINGLTDYSQPDWERLQEIAAVAKQALGNGKEIYGTDGETCFKLQQDQPFADDNNQHYNNFRVEFYSINN